MHNNRKITTDVSPLEKTLNEIKLLRKTLTEEQQASILAWAMQKVDWVQAE